MGESRIPLGTEDAGTESTRVERRNPLMGTGPALRMLRNVNVSTMTVHLPPDGAATGVGVVVCPSGAWHVLAVEHEADDVAAALNRRRIAAFVVEYRLQPTPLDDAEASAAIMAALSGPGGHLTVRLALAGVPDFALPIYAPVFEPPKAPADGPPRFVAVAADDVFGPLMVDGAIELARAWHEAGRPVELHLYADGGHGFGALPLGTTSDAWLDQALTWIERTTRAA